MTFPRTTQNYLQPITSVLSSSTSTGSCLCPRAHLAGWATSWVTPLRGRPTDVNLCMPTGPIFTLPIVTEALQENCGACRVWPPNSLSPLTEPESDSPLDHFSLVIRRCGKPALTAPVCTLYFQAGTIRPGSAAANGLQTGATSFSLARTAKEETFGLCRSGVASSER